MEVLNSPDTQIVNIVLAAIVLLVLMSVAIVLFFYFSRRRIVQSELEKANLQIEHQQAVIRSTIITQEQERKRIAQNLHDAISSKLNIVSLNANVLTEPNITSEETNKIGASILNVTTKVLESSRKIAHDLLPPTLDKFGLAAAIEELCEEIEETKKFDIQYDLKYKSNSLSSDKELHLFRILQELFSNTIKYAEATSIRLNLEKIENNVSLKYTDNGQGFSVSEAKKVKGLGLTGMEYRAAILNASFQLTSFPNKGVTVIISVPI